MGFLLIAKVKSFFPNVNLFINSFKTEKSRKKDLTHFLQNYPKTFEPKHFVLEMQVLSLLRNILPSWQKHPGRFNLHRGLTWLIAWVLASNNFSQVIWHIGPWAIKAFPSAHFNGFGNSSGILSLMPCGILSLMPCGIGILSRRPPFAWINSTRRVKKS